LGSGLEVGRQDRPGSSQLTPPMLFNSLAFALFFPLVTVLYFVLPHRLRGPMLLIASCYFYMAFIPKYILILALTIAVDYVAGLLIHRSTGRSRRLWLVTSIVANVGVLAFFKYFNFLNETIRTVSTAAGIAYSVPVLNIILPIGLSFHTFQSMSYTIEVYRGRQEVERNLGRFALYVMFYPQLVAGPIERPQNLLWQFKAEHRFDYQRAKAGLQLMAWGLFKKVAIADPLARIVNAVYGATALYSGTAILVATYLFAIQIYCDFSGYSDIAIGAAQVMGFSLMRNFARPYFSQSISEFWRRWHISLSTWFRDYVYFPLGGNRAPGPRRYFNLMTVFTLSGLWHGANWTFVFWGALNGAYLVGSTVFAGARQSLIRWSGLERMPVLVGAWNRVMTFHLILISWVFFRASSLTQATDVLQAIVSNRPGRGLVFENSGGRLEIFLALAVLVVCEILQSRLSLRAFIATKPAIIRWPVYVASVVAFLLLGDFTAEQQFIYFQF
jgi:alginate O-acetyltransferase complex protein AlgI